MKQTLGVIIPLHINGGDRQEFALQPTEDILLDILVAISQDGLRQRKFLGRGVGGVNAPASLELGFSDGRLITSNAQLIPDLAVEASWLAFVSPNDPFFDLTLVLAVKQTLDMIVLLDLLDRRKQTWLILNLLFAPASRRGQANQGGFGLVR